jgi:hypothetical protein
MSRGRDSEVGTATARGQDGPWLESRWGRDFHGSEAHPAACKLGTRSFPGGKAVEAWRWPPTPLSAEVKEKVELYLYSLSGSSWPIPGQALPTVALLNR